MFFLIYWPKNGLNPWKIKKDKMKTASAQNEFRFEEAQIKILGHDPKVAITMDNIISKFPVLAVRIFDSLDDENFVYCKAVNKSWSAFTNNDELFFFKRMRITLKKLIKGCKDFKVLLTLKFLEKNENSI